MDGQTDRARVFPCPCENPGRDHFSFAWEQIFFDHSLAKKEHLLTKHVSSHVLGKTAHSRFYPILLICLLGTLARLVYGMEKKPWNQSPDQYAWEMILDHSFYEGHFSYDQLIHYPHEGGTLLISILSLILKLFARHHSLVLSALILDFASRYVQLYVVRQVFKFQVSLAYGLWTIFAVPALIPWATVNFGMHSLCSFFPFVLLYLLWQGKHSRWHCWWHGMFLGLACWISYTNALLVPLYFLYMIVEKKPVRQWGCAFLSLALVLGIHAVVRTHADAGFHLAGYSVSSIRGTTFSLMEASTYDHVFAVWTHQFPGSTLLESDLPGSSHTLRVLWLTLVFTGWGGYFLSRVLRSSPPAASMGFWLIPLFVTLYAVSPFFDDETHTRNFIAYRHFAYILPLVSLYAIHGLFSLRVHHVLLPLYLFCGIKGYFHMFDHKPATYLPVKEAGWVLCAKFGHDVGRLTGIVEATRYDQAELRKGIGWSLGTTLFEGLRKEDSLALRPKLDFLVQTLQEFPASYRPTLVMGVEYAFEGPVLPKLDPGILDRIHERLQAAPQLQSPE